MKEKIKVHLKGCGHVLGIEYNYDKSTWENDASVFVDTCKRLLDKNLGWFHQCGSHTHTVDYDKEIFNNYKGYQFFEMLGCTDEDIFFSEITKIADAMNAEIEI